MVKFILILFWGQLENASKWDEAHNNLKTNTNEATDEMIKNDEWKTNTGAQWLK